MDSRRFDAFARSFTISRAQRRATVGALLGGGLTILLTRFTDQEATAKRRSKSKRKKKCKQECAPCERCKRGTCKTRPDGAECGNGGFCDGQECVCPKATCGQACVDLLTDANNCGVCGLRCPDGQSCLHGTCTCDPFNNTCPNDVNGQCTCGAVTPENTFQAACVDRNSACDLSQPCETHDDCPPRSVCLRGCVDPPATNRNRCSRPCIPV